MKVYHARIIWVLIFGVFISGTVYGSAKIYMEIPDIPGESNDVGYEDQIELFTWSFNIKRPITLSAGGRVPSKTTFSEVRVTKQLDKASPLLMDRLVSGTRIPTMHLRATRFGSGGAPYEYLVIELEDVWITGLSLSDTASGDNGEEIMTLNYGSLRYTYKDPQGAILGEVILEVIPTN